MIAAYLSAHFATQVRPTIPASISRRQPDTSGRMAAWFSPTASSSQSSALHNETVILRPALPVRARKLGFCTMRQPDKKSFMIADILEALGTDDDHNSVSGVQTQPSSSSEGSYSEPSQDDTASYRCPREEENSLNDTDADSERYSTGLTLPDTSFSSFYRRKPPRERTSFTSLQLRSLEQLFYSKKYLSLAERAKVASQLMLSEKQIKTWFQNRRTKYRRQRQCCVMPAHYAHLPLAAAPPTLPLSSIHHHASIDGRSKQSTWFVQSHPRFCRHYDQCGCFYQG